MSSHSHFCVPAFFPRYWRASTTRHRLPSAAVRSVPASNCVAGRLGGAGPPAAAAGGGAGRAAAGAGTGRARTGAGAGAAATAGGVSHTSAAPTSAARRAGRRG